MMLFDMTARDIFKQIKNGYTPTEAELKIVFPCVYAKLIPVEKIEYNDYNPNNVAPPELRLLKHSILEDGYTQPIVGIHNKEKDIYVVIDGAHRYMVGTQKLKLPYLPMTVINKEVKERMAATIRHNRARGEHGVTQMSNLVAELIMLGWEDHEIGKQLGMDADEVLRLKQNTGISEIFKKHDYTQAWE